MLIYYFTFFICGIQIINFHVIKLMDYENSVQIFFIMKNCIKHFLMIFEVVNVNEIIPTKNTQMRL